MSKRGRDDDDEVYAAAQELGGTLDRTHDVKLRALDRVLDLIDSDELYTNQKALVAADAAFYIVELLSDASDAVAVRAAAVVARMTEHSAATKARLHAGPLLGLESSVSHALLNPVQCDFVDCGAVAALVPWVCSAHQAKSAAAADAIAALCSYHHDGKVAYLEALVAALQGGQLQAIDPMDALLGGMECSGEDVVRLLEAAQRPLLGALGSVHTDAAAALGLLITLCEKAPDLRDELVAGGAIGLCARHLLHGALPAQDAAARALWLLAAGDDAVFGPDGELGRSAQQVADKLRALIDAANAEEEERENAEDAGRAESPRPYADDGSDAAANDICFAEDAQALLKALAAANPELDVDTTDALQRRTSCCIM